MSDDRRETFASLLRELDEQIQSEELPVGARNRIELSIREHEGPTSSTGWRRWLPALTFVAGATLVFAVVRAGAPGGAPPAPEAPAAATESAPMPVAATPPLEARSEIGGLSLAGDGCQGEAADGDVLLEGNCKLATDHLTAQVWGDAQVEERAKGIRIKSGQLLFDVDTVAAGEEPVTVAVSHGVIEVLGTRFIVDQRADGGHVDLFEGAIAFRAADGSVTQIGPGQRYRWGAPDALAMAEEPAADAEPEAVPTKATRPGRTRRAKGPSRAERAAAIIERVDALRAEHRYREAVAQLRAALDQRWDRRTAEVLSYELGEILHRHLGERQAACDHLDRHVERFGPGRYAEAIDRTLAKLQCG